MNINKQWHCLACLAPQGQSIKFVICTLTTFCVSRVLAVSSKSVRLWARQERNRDETNRTNMKQRWNEPLVPCHKASVPGLLPICTLFLVRGLKRRLLWRGWILQPNIQTKGLLVHHVDWRNSVDGCLSACQSHGTHNAWRTFNTSTFMDHWHTKEELPVRI